MSIQKFFIIRRIITTSNVPVSIKNRFAAYCVEQACQVDAEPVTVFQTPGGFLVDEQELQSFYTGVQSLVSEFKRVVRNAQKVVERFLSKNIRKLLAKNTYFFTLGLDVHDLNSDNHVELIGTYNTKKERLIYWTGKSYPVESQARTLLYCRELKTHFQYFGRTPILILGCHDLNIFSPWSRALSSSDSYKGQLIADMQRICDSFRPQVVLHHPHLTDSSKTWSTGWSGVRKFIPTTHTYSSGIHYKNLYGNARRQSLEKVLKGTAKGNVQDIIIDKAKR